jgi:predicted TIM-barrel fold metal-dependent hydrolase
MKKFLQREDQKRSCAIVREMCCGREKEFPMIIDVHTHAFPDFLAKKALDALSSHSGDYQPFIEGTAGALVRSMDDAGIDVSFLANIATRPGQVKSIIEWSKQVASDRIIPLGSFHPESPTWESDLDAVAAAGFPGVKFHPLYQNFAVDDERFFPVFEKLAENNLFVLVHAGYDIAFLGDDRASPERLTTLRRNVKNLDMIAAHLGGWQDWKNVFDILAGSDIYLDTSFSHEVEHDMLMNILSRHDSSRVLFGSDSPWTSQTESIAAIMKLPISDEFREKIFRRNAIELLLKRGYKVQEESISERD